MNDTIEEFSGDAFQTSVREDLSRLGEVVANIPSYRDIRHCVPIMRRLLFERSLLNAAFAKGVEMMLRGPNNKEYTNDGNRDFRIFSSGGSRFGASILRAYSLAKDGTSSIERDVRLTEWKPSTWLQHKVLFLDGVWATRQDVIKFVAYSRFGIHASVNKSASTFDMLNELQSCVIFSQSTHASSAIFRRDKSQPAQDELDAVFFELWTAMALLVESPDVVKFLNA